MSAKGSLPLENNESKILRTVFETVHSIKTPVQLICFLLAIVLAIVIFQASPAANVLAFVILLLPFILLILLVNKKILDTISNGGYALLIVAGLIIVGSFVT